MVTGIIYVCITFLWMISIEGVNEYSKQHRPEASDINGETDRQKDRHTSRQAGRDREKDTVRDRHTERQRREKEK